MSHQQNIEHALAELIQLMSTIVTLLENRQYVPPPTADQSKDETNKIDLDDMIDAVDVKSILHTSPSTLYRTKNKGILRTVRIGNKTFFSRKEIEALADHFKK